MIKVIKAPKDALGSKQVEQAIKNTMNNVAKAVQVDFKTTTRTWKNKPEFVIEAPSPDVRTVATDDKVYKMVEEGTKPHIIRPKNARALTWMGTSYRAKTRPGYIGSTGGGPKGNTIVYARIVQHPGTEARKFTVAIRTKWSKEVAIRMQAALVAAMQKK